MNFLKRFCVSAVVAVAMAASLVGVTSAPAFGQAAVSLPVLVPTPLPAGFTIAEASETSTSTARAVVGHIVYAAAGNGMFSGQPFSISDKRIQIASSPSDDRISSQIKSGGAGTTKVTIGKNRGLVKLEAGYGSLVWVDGNTAFNLQAIGPKVTAASLKTIALTVKPSKLQDRSFRLTKAPAGTTIRFQGSLSSLIGDHSWNVSYLNSTKEAITIGGSQASPIYLEIFLPFFIAGLADLEDSSELFAFTPFSVRGKQGVVFGPSLIWEESPNHLISLGSEDLNTDGLKALAETLQPLDLAGWTALKSEAEAAGDDSSPVFGGDTLGTAPTLAAGMVGSTPWTARAAEASGSSRCFRFDAGTNNATICTNTDFIASGVTWKSVVTEDKRTIVGISLAKVATVVLRDKNGTELARATPVPMLNTSVKAFVFQVGQAGTLQPVANGEAVLVGLDAAGAEAGPAVPLTP